jgi:hypothetical protein
MSPSFPCSAYTHECPPTDVKCAFSAFFVILFSPSVFRDDGKQQNKESKTEQKAKANAIPHNCNTESNLKKKKAWR